MLPRANTSAFFYLAHKKVYVVRDRTKHAMTKHCDFRCSLHDCAAAQCVHDLSSMQDCISLYHILRAYCMLLALIFVELACVHAM